MSVLKCEKLSKSYRKKEVLKELDLELESGKIYGLIGRNGAGKTTLLSLMASQVTATSGSVTLDGENIWENRKALERIYFGRELTVTTDSCFAGYSVKRFMETAAFFRPNWDKEMAERLIKEFGLKPKAKLGKLSKGMLSMVSIVAAMASKAEFTFLDEPTSGLDVVARERFYQILLDEYTETGRTFVISTHIIEEAAELMEETIILDQGRILCKENTQSLLERACYIAGAADQVDAATAGLECHRPESIGRSKGVTVLLKEGQSLPTGYDLTVQPVTLEKVFVALCTEGE